MRVLTLALAMGYSVAAVTFIWGQIEVIFTAGTSYANSWSLAGLLLGIDVLTADRIFRDKSLHIQSTLLLGLVLLNLGLLTSIVTLSFRGSEVLFWFGLGSSLAGMMLWFGGYAKLRRLSYG